MPGLPLSKTNMVDMVGNDVGIESKISSVAAFEQSKGQHIVYLKNTQFGLGLKICGGLEHNGCKDGIFIKKILLDGLADKSGKLQAGDQLREVNGFVLDNCSHSEAIAILRSAAQSGVTRIVYTRNEQSRQKFQKVKRLEAMMPVSPSSSIDGINLAQANSWSVSSSSHRLPSVCSSITGQSWTGSDCRDSLFPVSYESLKLPSHGAITSSGTAKMLESDKLRAENAGTLLASDFRPASLDSGLPPSLSPPGVSEPEAFDATQIQMITIPATTVLGVGVQAFQSGDDGYSVFISEIIPGGDAHEDGRLKVGDVLVAINGESLTDTTIERARSILTRLKLRKSLRKYEIAFVRRRLDPLSNAASSKSKVEPGAMYGSESARRLGSPSCNLPTPSPKFLEGSTTYLPTPGSKSLECSSKFLPDRSEISSGEDEQILNELVDLMTDIQLPSTGSDDGEPFVMGSPLNGSLPSCALHSTPYHPSGQASKDRCPLPRPPKLLKLPKTDASTAKSEPSLILSFNEPSKTVVENRLMKKLSFDATTPIHIEKLDAVMSELGYSMTPEQRQEIRIKARPGLNGIVSYGSYVDAARKVLNDVGLSNSLDHMRTHFSAQDEPAHHGDSPIMQLPLPPGRSHRQSSRRRDTTAMSASYQDEVYRLRRERDDALLEVEHLRDSLQARDRSCTNLEEEISKSRRVVAVHQAEVDSLRHRIKVATEAQSSTKASEQEYFELVQKLRQQIATLESKGGSTETEFNEMQRRLVVLGCQLRKAEVSKRTYEVAVDKLTRFAESVVSALSDDPKVKVSGRRKPPPQETFVTIANQAKDTVRIVKMLLEEEPLPFGWEEVYADDGSRYFINHVTQTTSWSHPISGVQYTAKSRSGNKGSREAIPSNENGRSTRGKKL